MYVHHKEFGWGKIIQHDIEKNLVKVDFTDNPYGNEKIEKLNLNELQNPQNAFEEVLTKHDKSVDDFRIIPTIVYRDRMNDGEYIAYDEVICVPKEYAAQVSYVTVNFTMDAIKLFDNDNKLLMTSPSEGYADLANIQLFVM